MALTYGVDDVALLHAARSSSQRRAAPECSCFCDHKTCAPRTKNQPDIIVTSPTGLPGKWPRKVETSPDHMTFGPTTFDRLAGARPKAA